MKLLLLFILINVLQADKSLEDCDKLIVSGIEAMQNKEYTTSLELLTEAKTLAENNNWHRQRFLALNNIGANYYSMLDYGEALNNYLEAYTIAIKELDPNHEMIVLNNIAILYTKENQFDKAEEYFKKAFDIAKNKEEWMKVAMYGINLGLVANQQNKVQIAKEYFEEAIPILNEHPSLLIQAEMGLAENYFKQNNFEKAKYLSNSLIQKLEDSENDEFKVFVYLNLSRIYEAENDIETAINYAEQSLKSALNPENKITVYEWMAELHFKNNNLPKALTAKDSLIAAKDEFNLIKNGRLFETNKVKFEIQSYQNELIDNRVKMKTERKTFYILLSFALLTIFLFAWALYNNFIKSKQRRIIDESTREIISLELEKEKSDKLLLKQQMIEKDTIRLLEQEKLKNEIDTRNRKLAAKALHLSNRNELIEQIIDSLSTQSEVSKNNLLSNYVKQLKSHLKNDTEWESFFKHFEEVNHGFLTSLKEKHPLLNSNDLRLLSYMYMNLSTKEIALLFNITPLACRKRKERISNKMGLSKHEDLYDYITDI